MGCLQHFEFRNNLSKSYSCDFFMKFPQIIDRGGFTPKIIKPKNYIIHAL